MKIRTRLFALLLPTMTLFVILISLFFFLNWKGEITDNFRDDLKSIVVTTADLLNPDEMTWIVDHVNDPELQSSSIYKRNYQKLHALKEKLPVTSLYIVAIEPVKIGEPVIIDQPVSETNKIYDGSNAEYSYRQIYLIDTEKDPSHSPYYDYSESNEQLLYKTPKAFATSIYQAKGTDELFMSGFAPLMNSQQRVIALVGANLNIDLLDHMVHRAILLIILASLVTLLLVAIAVYLITNKISEPVQKLKEAALSLAAGEYEEKISVQGPREIVELANTYNTMRECLLEHINRLRDISYSREMLFGEQECALLLQHRMLDGVIDRFDDGRLVIKHVTTPLNTLTHGFKLSCESQGSSLNLTLVQSKDEGFEGIYHLIDQKDAAKGTLSLQFDFDRKTLSMSATQMPLGLYWSIQQGKFLPDSQDFQFQIGDLVLFYNQELSDAFPTRAAIKEWVSKVLRQFGKDPVELLTSMLGSELNFWQKKQPMPRQAHLFLVKIQDPKNLKH